MSIGIIYSMKNAIIFHGVSNTPDDYWYPYLKNELVGRGYCVSVPQLPEKDTPNLSLWLERALEEMYTPDTLLVGHSSGASLILSILERVDVKVAQAILVAGFCMPLKEMSVNGVLQERYNWEKIRQNVVDITFINSVNDPWGCTDIQGRTMFDQIGGKLIINRDGHMGSTTYDQPYKEFPFLLKLIS